MLTTNRSLINISFKTTFTNNKTISILSYFLYLFYLSWFNVGFNSKQDKLISCILKDVVFNISSSFSFLYELFFYSIKVMYLTQPIYGSFN